jgi:hypothetical protein
VGTRGAPGAALRWEAGAGAQGTRVGPRATLRGSRAALSREVGTGSVGTRGTPGAALRREAGGGAGPRAAPSREVGLDTRCPWSCPEPIYYWLFLVISS